MDVIITATDDKVRISIRDYGCGISQEFKSRIFGKFSQENTSLAREKGGSGLGLNISKQIVERMNGAIGFETQLNEGTTFWIEFPRAV
ncbi:ATP-binding protein [Legionella sp. km772]|nr:ATP-binding protein [Legionella sp. km772]